MRRGGPAICTDSLLGCIFPLRYLSSSAVRSNDNHPHALVCRVNSRKKTLADIIHLSALKVSSQKLSKLLQLVETSYNASAEEIVADDPFAIRRSLVSQLKREGSTAGVIQAYEQFFMGLVRRAAVEGIIPAPPEGPWTRNWQLLLDFAHETKSSKSAVRILAAWASDNELEPDEMTSAQLTKWRESTAVADESLAVMTQLLAKFRQCDARMLNSKLTDRLRRRAMHGSVNGE